MGILCLTTHLPPDLALFIKAFVSLEGMGRDLDPDLDLDGEAVPMLRRSSTRYAPAALAKRGWHAASEISRLMSDLPRDISHLLRSARRGRLEIHIDVVISSMWETSWTAPPTG